MDEGDLTALLGRHASRHSVPGAVVGVLRDGAATTAAYGVGDVRTGEPVTSETLFSLGSLTKSMVATVVVRLAQAGLLSLDDPVAARVPELRRRRWAESSTLRDLLANRSTIPLRSRLEFCFDGGPDEDDGALSRLVADIPNDAPAPRFWSYSNVAWCVLGRVIEVATDSAWEDAMRRHFTSVGLVATTFGTDTATQGRSSGHEVVTEGPVPVEPMVGRSYGPAGTTAVSTVADLLRFAALHVEDPSLAEMRDVHADVSIYGWLDSWCLGCARFDWEGGPAWGWDGVVNGERSFLRILPQQHAAVALMTNAGTGRAMCRSLLADITQPLFGMAVPPLHLDPVPGAAGDLSRFAGVYAWPDRRVEVTVAGDGLLIKSEHDETEALPIDERTFLVDVDDPDNPTATFGAYDGSGRPHVLYLMLWGLPRLDH